MKPIVLVGEARGEAEARLGSSFVGPSGAALLRMLHDAQVITFSSFDWDYLNKFYSTNDSSCIEAVWRLHDEVYRTNVFNLHPPGNDLTTLCGPAAMGVPGYPILVKSKYVRGEFQPELDRLANEILSLDPNLIICLGNTPLWALCGKTGIKKFRGSTVSSTFTVADYKLLPTYHPAFVL